METLDLRSPRASVVVVQAQLGERAALDAVLRALQGPLHAHIMLVVRDADLAHDVLQDSLWTVCKKLRWLRDPKWFRAWAFRIATREAVRQLSRARRRADQPADDESELDRAVLPTEEPRFQSELLGKLPELIASLPHGCQTVVRLRYVDEMSVAEISEVLEIPQGTVKSRLAYGLAKLRASLSAVV